LKEASDTNNLSINEKEFLLVEKYRPKNINDIIINEELRVLVKSWIQSSEIPNILLSSKAPGLGKTSLAHTIIQELQTEALFVNASMYPNIDILRNKIKGFASTASFDGRAKIVVLDEADSLNCLEENEEILLASGDYVKLKDLTEGSKYDVISFNTKTEKFEKDYATLVDSRIDEIYEIEMEDGSKIKVNKTHPFMVVDKDNNITTRTIEEGFDDVSIIFKSGDEQWITKKVKTITKLEVGRVVDLTVHNNNNFITKNGFVVHNTSSTQPALRGFIEEFSKNCRFILTCNYKDKIIEPIQNRLINIDFDLMFITYKKELVKQMFFRTKDILNNEKIEYKVEDLKYLISHCYPSSRTILNKIQEFTVIGDKRELVINKHNIDSEDLNTALIEAIKDNNFNSIRTICNKLVDPGSIFSVIYENIDVFEQSKRPGIIIIAAKYSGLNSQVRDKLLNAVACLVEIAGSL